MTGGDAALQAQALRDSAAALLQQASQEQRPCTARRPDPQGPGADRGGAPPARRSRSRLEPAPGYEAALMRPLIAIALAAGRPAGAGGRTGLDRAWDTRWRDGGARMELAAARRPRHRHLPGLWRPDRGRGDGARAARPLDRGQALRRPQLRAGAGRPKLHGPLRHRRVVDRRARPPGPAGDRGGPGRRAPGAAHLRAGRQRRRGRRPRAVGQGRRRDGLRRQGRRHGAGPEARRRAGAVRTGGPDDVPALGHSGPPRGGQPGSTWN